MTVKNSFKWSGDEGTLACNEEYQFSRKINPDMPVSESEFSWIFVFLYFVRYMYQSSHTYSLIQLLDFFVVHKLSKLYSFFM